MKLEVLPVKEQGGSRILPRRRGGVRVIWIIWNAPNSTLSGGYTLRTAPMV